MLYLWIYYAIVLHIVDFEYGVSSDENADAYLFTIGAARKMVNKER